MIQYEYHSEGTHGVRTTCKDIPGLRSTLFPQTTALAATGNMTLIEEMAGVMGTEGRALNNIANGTTFDKGTGLDYWGPTTNIGCAPSPLPPFPLPPCPRVPAAPAKVGAGCSFSRRDPRWGRFQESISECPVLNAHYVRAFIRGIQGDGPVMKIAATCKHFYAYSLEDSDGFTRHDFDAVVSERDLRETYLVPFSACAAAGVASVMCSYNAVNHLPTCLDGHAQNGILRGEFGFDGPIVSDCGARECSVGL